MDYVWVVTYFDCYEPDVCDSAETAYKILLECAEDNDAAITQLKEEYEEDKNFFGADEIGWASKTHIITRR